MIYLLSDPLFKEGTDSPHGREVIPPRGIEMPARSEWKGFLEVNQLKIPVKAFSAAKSQPDISLNQLHRECGKRIRQQRICPEHGLVDSDAIIPGYQVADNCYLPLDPNEIEQLRPESNKAISVECFIDQKEIDPVYHAGRTLYLVPDGPTGQRSFGVLREGMKVTGRHAFSRIVMSRREHLVLLRPTGRLLAMTIIEYPHRIRPSTDYESEVVQITPAEQELKLIGQLIEVMTERNFDLSHYRDRYLDDLSALIERKVAEADLVSTPSDLSADDNPRESDEALIALLQASLSDAGVSDLSFPHRPNRVPGSFDGVDQSQKLA